MEPWTLCILDLGLHFFLILVELQVHREQEGGAFLILRDKINVAIELHDHLFGDKETKSNLLSIAQQHLLLVLVAHDLENSLLILWVDANSLIVYDKNDLLLIPVIADVDVDPTVEAAINCVLDNIDSHLLNSLWVSNYIFWKLMIVFLEILYIP
jgi:hypothetical protein